MPETTAPSRAAVTIAEAAKMYGVSAKTIRLAIRAGELKAKHVGSGEDRLHARILHTDLQAWFDSLPDA